MFSRVVSSALAAVAVLAAIPALASEHPGDAATRAQPACCAQMTKDLEQRAEAAAKQALAEYRAQQQGAQPATEDGSTRHPYWEGP